LDTCPFHFRLPIIPNETIGLHFELLFKKINVELCARKYVTLEYGLVNGAYGIFEDYTKAFSKSFILINFQNPQIGSKTRIKNSEYTENFLD